MGSILEIEKNKDKVHRVKSGLSKIVEDTKKTECVFCHFKEQCYFCPSSCGEKNKDMFKQCRYFKDRIEDLLRKIRKKADRYNIKFTEGVVILEKDNSVLFKKIYKDNNSLIKELVLSKSIKEIIKNMYCNEVNYRELLSKNSEELDEALEILIFNDFIRFMEVK